MATAELSVHRRWLPAGLWHLWLRAYAAVWTVMLVLAAGTALAAVGARRSVRHLLGLSLKPDPAPQVGHVLALAAHNIPIVSWPLLLGVMGAHRSRVGRGVADTMVAACVFANVLPVGAALGAYGAQLLPYLPHLPLEWGSLALGASGWLVQRRVALTVREGLGLFAVIAGVLVCAAILETVAVPHR
jgi:hypothetical protein